MVDSIDAQALHQKQALVALFDAKAGLVLLTGPTFSLLNVLRTTFILLSLACAACLSSLRESIIVTALTAMPYCASTSLIRKILRGSGGNRR